MPRYLLDTDHISFLQRGDERVIQRYETVTSDYVAVSIVSFEEQLKGRLAVVSQAKPESLEIAYYRLQEMQEFFCLLNVVGFDRNAKRKFLELKKQYRRLGTMDLRIAATALSLDSILVTRNRKDFAQITELNIENWA
jgi:tRNA(fMet)-specific endonuclease VapC